VFVPTVQVYVNAETMTANATPAATITMQIVDNSSGSTPQPQEMYYDPVNDRMFASDDVTTVAVFDHFGAQALAAVVGHTNPTIAANRYLQGLQSPDGLAYSPKTDTLFVGDEHNKAVLVIAGASILNGPVPHPPTITGFNLPGDMAFDEVHGFILFVFDGSQIDVIPNALVASGSLGTLPGVKIIFDAQTQLSGFGMALDTTH
jgi:DNA-binding beta-propeller fold protein YncE